MYESRFKVYVCFARLTFIFIHHSPHHRSFRNTTNLCNVHRAHYSLVHKRFYFFAEFFIRFVSAVFYLQTSTLSLSTRQSHFHHLPLANQPLYLFIYKLMNAKKNNEMFSLLTFQVHFFVHSVQSQAKFEAI